MVDQMLELLSSSDRLEEGCYSHAESEKDPLSKFHKDEKWAQNLQKPLLEGTGLLGTFLMLFTAPDVIGHQTLSPSLGRQSGYLRYVAVRGCCQWAQGRSAADYWEKLTFLASFQCSAIRWCHLS